MREIVFQIKGFNNQLKRLMIGNLINEEDNALTGMQYGIIRYIGQRENEEIFQRDIEKEFNIRRSTASGILQLMEKNGLIHRHSVKGDARLKRIVLTEKALEHHKQAEKKMKQIDNKIKLGISEEEIEIFLRILNKMKENLKHC